MTYFLFDQLRTYRGKMVMHLSCALIARQPMYFAADQEVSNQCCDERPVTLLRPVHIFVHDLLAISFFKYTFSFMYLFISCQGTFGESLWPDTQLQICNLRREEHLKFVHSIILVPKSNVQKPCSLYFLLCQAPRYIPGKKNSK